MGLLGWKVFELTYTWYARGSTISMMLGISSLAPLVIGIGLATLVLFRRDLQTIGLALTLVSTAPLNSIVKSIIKQPRPIESLKSGYGMPSHHAHYMACFAVYVTLMLIRRCHVHRFTRYFLTFLCWTAAFVVCVSRYVISVKTLTTYLLMMSWSTSVHLMVHTLDQVAVGSIVGFVHGALSFSVINEFILKRFAASICRWKLAQALYIVDYGHIQNVFEHQYQAANSEIKQPSHQLSTNELLIAKKVS